MDKNSFDNIKITRNIVITYSAWLKARKRAEQQNISLSRYIESLIERDDDGVNSHDELESYR